MTKSASLLHVPDTALCRGAQLQCARARILRRLAKKKRELLHKSLAVILGGWKDLAKT